ncbi:hypothetical protein BT96DRAFT_868482 [Gymnopus androsaceus JB14]|uniref:S-adenosyl-L-methionine-dependent methyltransferase n=1 Tax=Gymnopus androsaceus JB14 TaxID=1447944 RepID=A0A6A4GIP2_9AGAR|nr:hypothetical protein BT96DRAFT_868482 [Gymnopus androsaceus JB14]
MRLCAAFSLLGDLKLAMSFALIPTLKDVVKEPSMLLKPIALSRTFMAHVWVKFGAGTDDGARKVKQGLIPPFAGKIVLDIGAGHGHTVNYLERHKVQKYIALEPNVLMHGQIRDLANQAGYAESDGTLVILPYGAEDITSILKALSPSSGDPPVDTLISVLTMCSIPDPQNVMARLVRDVLKPGGQFLFYEHVLSPRPDVAWWQRFWSPLWQLPFDGCRLDRPTHIWIDKIQTVDSHGDQISVWSEQQVWGKEGEPDEHLFWHRVGRYVKRA